MVKQIEMFIANYPWIFILIGGVLIGTGIVIVVTIIRRKNFDKQNRSFEILDGREELAKVPVRLSPSFLPKDDDVTYHLFDFPDIGLKSYQLELYDLNISGMVYRTNVSDRITIGRRPGCIVCISNSTLSGEHCEIVLRNGKMYLHDLDSTNGTFLNGCQNRITEEELVSGSIIEMGSVKLKVQITVVGL